MQENTLNTQEWHNTGLEIRSKSGMIIANVYNHLPSNQSKGETLLYARLISASPELLEALQGVVRLKELIEYPKDTNPEHHDEAKAISMMLKGVESVINKVLGS